MLSRVNIQQSVICLVFCCIYSSFHTATTTASAFTMVQTSASLFPPHSNSDCVLSLSSSSQTEEARQQSVPLKVTMERMEQTVKRYFQGVQEKDPIMIRSCFEETAIIRDVCAVTNSQQRTVSADDLVQRCIDFVTAHPDCNIQFYYGPISDRDGVYVFAHWYETGTWSNKSCNISPPLPNNNNNYNAMSVEGQTRFLVNPTTFKIEQLIVTRTFTEWEKQLNSMKTTP